MDIFKVSGLLPQSFVLSLGLIALNFVFAAIHRAYLLYLVVPKKEYYRGYTPSSKQWVESVTALQNNEFKGLAVLAVVVLGIGYFTDHFNWSAALMIIFLSLSLYTFLAGLYRPEYILTGEGIFLLNWFPPYMNRNMGFYAWSRFSEYEAKDNVILLGGPKIITIVCQDSDFAEIRRYVKRHLSPKKDGKAGKG